MCTAVGTCRPGAVPRVLRPYLARWRASCYAVRRLPMTADSRKRRGAYFTPEDAVAALVRWAVRHPTDRMLDPSCGDGRFLAQHANSVGVEQHAPSVAEATHRAPHAFVHHEEFFTWASQTPERFDCAAGNPPFIRYQNFSGETRERALTYCRSLGATFSALTSSWAPFLVATASLLKPGGRIAFVVPAEIGHATYARPLLDYFLGHFKRTQIVAVRNKIFPDLSEDAWLLYADGFGSRGDGFLLTAQERFSFTSRPPRRGTRIAERDWNAWNGRLRPFLLQSDLLSRYRGVADLPKTKVLGDVAKVGIGYVTGANDFFHLRPSVVASLGIPRGCLHHTVRNGRMLTEPAVTRRQVQNWIAADEAVLLLKLDPDMTLPGPVRKYLQTDVAGQAMLTYKCRNREPWYVVPDVFVPDAFLTYMSGRGPSLVANEAGCVGTNSVHTVRLRKGHTLPALKRLWDSPIRELSCELEGHPLGGGLLKIEPREASRILLGRPPAWTAEDDRAVSEALCTLRAWRHCDNEGEGRDVQVGRSD